MEKTNRKKNWIIRIAVIAAALTLITCCVFGSTLAKYTTSASSAASNGSVAAWSWEINDVAAADNFTFNLFDSAETLEENGTSADADVTQGKVAPGTSGKVEIKIENLSQVSGTYAITFTQGGTQINGAYAPIQFSKNGTDYGTLASCNVSATTLAKESGSATVTLYWKWAFTGDDAVDTAFGTYVGGATVTVTAAATFTQVD